jgi:hypothetical protein
MEFFKSDDGRLHAMRIFGVFFICALSVGCLVEGFDRMYAARLATVAGFTLALGGKHVPVRTVDITGNPAKLFGFVLAVVSILGQFYVTWSHNHSHL